MESKEHLYDEELEAMEKVLQGELNSVSVDVLNISTHVLQKIYRAMSQYALQKQGGVDVPSVGEINKQANEKASGQYGIMTDAYSSYVKGFRDCHAFILTTCQATNAQEGVKLPSEEEIIEASKARYADMENGSLSDRAYNNYYQGLRREAFIEGAKIVLSSIAAPPQELKPLSSITDASTGEGCKRCKNAIATKMYGSEPCCDHCYKMWNDEFEREYQ